MPHFILNFHGIGHPPPSVGADERHYWVPEGQFDACLDIVCQARSPIGITFDDGNESDYAVAFPRLKSRSIPALFFVLTDRIGKPGSLSAEQLAEIASAPGYAVGSHGKAHKAWTSLSDADLEREARGSRETLEGLLDKKIDQAGLPFGRYDRRTLRALAQAGYREVYSSDGGPRLSSLWPTPRMSVRQDTDIATIAHRIGQASRPGARFATEARALLKSLR